MGQGELKKRYLNVSFGAIAYLETGTGNKPPLLLVHGIPTSGFLWRHVLVSLQEDFHCYAPDLMGLGDTEADPEGDHFHMDAQAEMLLEFMSALGHERFCVICHDQGGAAVQIMAARHPEKLECMVFTDCVCYDNWPSAAIRRLQAQARRFPRLMHLLARSGYFGWRESRTRFSSFRRAAYSPERFSSEAIREYIRPMRDSTEGFRRFIRFLLAGDPRYTLGAVPGLMEFRKPVMIIWAADDTDLPPSWGRRLYEDIPGACRFELVPCCGHFWQEERPEEFVSLIRDFLSVHYEPSRSS
jgi:pimeloyl-ACP methyl ester carboxylesterase